MRQKEIFFSELYFGTQELAQELNCDGEKCAKSVSWWGWVLFGNRHFIPSVISVIMKNFISNLAMTRHESSIRLTH